MFGQVQPEIADEIRQAVRKLVENAKPLIVVGLIAVAGWSLGWFSTRKR